MAIFIGIFQKSFYENGHTSRDLWGKKNPRNLCLVCLTVPIQVEEISLKFARWNWSKFAETVLVEAVDCSIGPHLRFVWIDAFGWITYDILTHVFQKSRFFYVFWRIRNDIPSKSHHFSMLFPQFVSIDWHMCFDVISPKVIPGEHSHTKRESN